MINSTADAAKLPCPFCGTQPLGSPLNNALEPKRSLYLLQCPSGKCPVRPKVYGTDRADAKRRWNTRPQPAPPAGEPDFDIMNGELEQEFYRTGGDRTHGYIRRYLVTRAYRLGLAARPKVEDAVIADQQKKRI